MNGSGMSLILEWVGKPQAASVFPLVTGEHQADGLSKGRGGFQRAFQQQNIALSSSNPYKI